MYCLYARVSTKRQGDSGLGLQAQRDIVKHFYPDIHREFVEVRSGKNIQDRPILAEAIEYCLKHDMVLVVAKVDRLTRSTKDGLDILDRLKGRIRFCDLPGEPDKFMLTLFFAFAERERELISIRTKGALKSAKERGKMLGVSNPNGGRKPWLEEYRMLANECPYGKLYNWYAVNNEAQLCPTDWHVPTKAEWDTLITFLGGGTIAGSQAKSSGFSYWRDPNTGAANTSGFSGLPAGQVVFNGTYNSLGIKGYWWSSTKHDTDNASAFFQVLNYSEASFPTFFHYKSHGFSVRCVMD